MGLEDEKFSLYRNYFAGKMHSQDISTVYYGMRGLKNLVDQAFLQPTHSNIVSFNGETINLSYKAVDAFGQPVEITKVKSAKLIQLSTGAEINVVDKIQIRDKSGILVVFEKSMDLDWASYRLETVLMTGGKDFKSQVYNSVKFTIKTKISDQVTVLLSQTANQAHPEEHDYNKFPAEFEQMNANAYPYIHA
jgi:hypothetical protein